MATRNLTKLFIDYRSSAKANRSLRGREDDDTDDGLLEVSSTNISTTNVPHKILRIKKIIFFYLKTQLLKDSICVEKCRDDELASSAQHSASCMGRQDREHKRQHSIHTDHEYAISHKFIS